MKKLLIFVLLILSAFCAYAQEIDPELLKRAEAGDAEAQTDVGLIYANAKNHTKAFEWFSKAANQGHARAQYNISISYYDGLGVLQDHNQAFEWSLKAASQGYAYAQYNLAILYRTGEGVKQDNKQAFDWYLKAANQGNTYAAHDLGLMYKDGKGTSKDLVTACAWMYISKNTKSSDFCDSTLTSNQLTRALKLKDEFLAHISE